MEPVVVFMTNRKKNMGFEVRKSSFQSWFYSTREIKFWVLGLIISKVKNLFFLYLCDLGQVIQPF